MTYKYGTTLPAAFEVDPDGSLSDPAGLVSAWPLTEMGGVRRDRRGHFDLCSTGGMETLAQQTGPGFSTSVKHAGDLAVMDLDGNSSGGSARADSDRNRDKMAFALCNTDWGYTSAYSWCVWFNVGVLQATQAMLFTLANDDDLSGGFRVQQSSDETIMLSSGDPRTDLSTTATITIDTWHFVCATWDGTTRRLYLDDNANVNDTSGAPTAAATNGKLAFGRFTRSTTNWVWTFYGKMCHGAMWNKALTSDQVATMYNGGVPNRYNPNG